MKLFTQTEIQFIKDHLEDMTFNEIAQALGRDKCTVEIKAKKLGLKKKRINRNVNQYSPEEDQFVKDNYNKLTYAEIATHLKRPKDSVRKCAKRLGLKDNKKPWSHPTLKMIKQNMALRSNLKPQDIPDQLAELKKLQIELKNSL